MQVKRAAVYIRVSSKVQDDGYSPEIQERDCREYAAQHGLEVTEVFRDVHTGVQLWERPALTRMREEMQRGSFDAIIFHVLDRLARDPIYQEFVIENAVRYNIDVHCVLDPIDQSDTGRLIRYLKGWKAKLEHDDIRRRTQSGRQARVKSGKPLPGPRAMYGYLWADDEKSRVVPNPDTAPIVQRIYYELASGRSALSIANGLSADAVPTPSGQSRHWRSESIRDMVKRPHYYGRPLGWVNRERAKAAQYALATDALELPAEVFPALVDEPVWQRANDELRIRHISQPKETGRIQTALLVGGFIRCGYCGRPMCTKWWMNRYQNYACNGERGVKGSCEMPTLSVRKIDTAVWSKIDQFMSQPEVILAELERHRSTDPTAEDSSTLERQLREIERQLANLTRRLAVIDDDDIAALVMTELKSLKERQARLVEERDRLQMRRAQWEAAQEHIDSVGEWCQSVSRNLHDLTYD